MDLKLQTRQTQTLSQRMIQSAEILQMMLMCGKVIKRFR